MKKVKKKSTKTAPKKKSKKISPLVPPFKLSSWAELRKEDLADFLQIVHILNRFIATTAPTNPAMLERQKIVERPKLIEKVLLNKYGKYDYMIVVFLTDRTASNITWVHIDGIMRERDELTAKNISNHPVFDICCMGDLYEKAIQK